MTNKTINKQVMQPEGTTRSPLRTVQILYELARSSAPVSLADLSLRLSLPKSSLFRLLKTLESGDYVVGGADGYKIGSEALKLGSAIVQARQFPNCALSVMQEVSDECGETIILGTLADSGQDVLYAEVIDGVSPLRFISRAGSSNPLYGSASGQIILAHMPEDERNAYLSTVELNRLAPGTITDTGALLAQLENIRLTGFSESNEGLVEDVYSVAAPVVDEDGRVIAGLSISAPSSRALRQLETFKGLVLRGGQEVSRILGYTGRYPLVANGKDAH